MGAREEMAVDEGDWQRKERRRFLAAFVWRSVSYGGTNGEHGHSQLSWSMRAGTVKERASTDKEKKGKLRSRLPF